MPRSVVCFNAWSSDEVVPAAHAKGNNTCFHYSFEDCMSFVPYEFMRVVTSGDFFILFFKQVKRVVLSTVGCGFFHTC